MTGPELEFRDPPPKRYPGKPQNPEHLAVAEALRENPGRWACIATYTREHRTAAYGLSDRIKRAIIRAYAPVGSFEAAVRITGDNVEVYARYVGEVTE